MSLSSTKINICHTKSSTFHNCPSSSLHPFFFDIFSYFKDFNNPFISTNSPIPFFPTERLEFCFGGVNAFYLVQVCGVDWSCKEFDEE